MDMPVRVLGSLRILAFFGDQLPELYKTTGYRFAQITSSSNALERGGTILVLAKFCVILRNVPSHYRYWQQLMPVLVMYRTHTGTGQKCKNANTSMGTI